MAEFGTAFGANLVTEFVKSISGAIKQQIFYVFKYQSYIDDLNSLLQELRLKREREQQRVEHSTSQGDKIHTDVEKWITNVNEFINGNEGRAETRCFKGLCPNLMARYKVGKKAVKATKAGSNLLGQNFSSVSYRPSLQRTESMFVRDYEAFDSRESIFQTIMETLEDETVNRIGVYGMGGVGKTTLVKKVAWQAIEDKLFDDVIMVEVTQKPDYRKIQEKIACDLALEFGQHETEFQRARRLHNRLKEGKRVLVVLDNIWAKLDFEVIGIPLGDNEKGKTPEKEGYKGISDDQSKRLYKILLTSRSIDVLRNDMNTGKNNFPLESLSSKEAQNLFWKIVSDNFTENSNFQTKGGEIIKKCAGLPLAIATIASALKNKSIHAWEDALDKLRTSNPRSIPEMDERVVSVIELSFNLLQNDEAKKLFLLCSLINFDGITLDYLLRYGIGWGLFQNVYALENGRNRMHMLIDYLKDSSLLLEGDTKSSVKMHEFVHAVAISIASTSKLMFNIPDVPDLNNVLEEKIYKSSTAISLPFRDISELPERLECPKLELLLLFMNFPSLKIPDSFLEGMKQLKVIGFNGINLQSLPSLFGGLSNLQTLCLDGCLLGDISTIGELKNLKILSFSRSDIEQLPREIGQLSQLKLLDLSDCSSLTTITANVISKLSRLEELYLDKSFVQWENGLHDQNRHNANLVELTQLPRLTTLSICIPVAQIITPDLFIQELNRFRILIGDVWNWPHRIETSRMLMLKLNNRSYIRHGPIKMLLERAEELYLDELNGVQNVIYDLDKEGFANLKYLHLQNGPKLLHIANFARRIPCNAFPKLEVLSLDNLINLKMICLGPLKEYSFNKLKTVKVNKCDGLRHLFSISMAKNLSQLEEIKVTNCENLKVMFAEEEDELCVRNHSETYSKIEFVRLRSLTVEWLPQFTSFSRTTEDPEDCNTLFGKRVVLPALLELRLSSITTEMICSNKFLATSCFENLTILEIQGCRNIRYLFPSCMVKSLIRLQQLTIYNCKSLEWVILTEEEGINEMMVFPRLQNLLLKNLPSLKMFCKYTGNLTKFPSLSSLVIYNCNSMETFISNSISAIAEDSKEKLPAHVQPLFDEKVSFPKLKTLKVSNMDNLRKIWDDDLLNLDSFSKLAKMDVSDCNKLLNIFPSIMHGRLQRLKVLKVCDCESVEDIFQLQSLSDRETNVITASQLRNLGLYYLPKLKHVWNMHNRVTLGFQNLVSIDVYNCNNLESIFPASVARELLQLQVLRINSCMVDKIVHKEEEVEAIPRFTFPQLTKLTFSSLPRLRCFCSGMHMSEWPVLRHLKVSECSKVQTLVSEFSSLRENYEENPHEIIVQCPLFLVDEISFPNLEKLELSELPELLHLLHENSQLSEVFQNLATLTVSECNKLRNIAPSSVSFLNITTLKVSKCDGLMSLVTSPTAKSLMQLRRIDISDCKRIEQIITVADLENEVKDEIVFKELKYLGLGNLPSLRSFYLGNCNLEFPSLDQVIVRECSKMVTFSQGVLSTSKLQTVKRTEEENGGCWKGDLNTIRQMFKEMVVLPALLELRLSSIAIEMICNNKLLSTSCFRNLTILEVDGCDNLRYLFPSCMVESLVRLQQLRIDSCSSLELVILTQEEGMTDMIVFPRLKFLMLKDLPSLKTFCKYTGNLTEFPSLSSLVLDSCIIMETFISNSIFAIAEDLKAKLPAHIQPLFDEKVSFPNLKTLKVSNMDNLRKIWDDDHINLDSFSKLAKMDVSDCNKLLNIFPSIVHGRLQRLRVLKVCDCESVEDIFQLQTLSCRETNAITASQLRELKLYHLPKLKHVWNMHNRGILGFQNLVSIEVYNCNNMESIFPASIARELLQLQVLSINSCMVDEIVHKEKEVEAVPRFMFPQLTKLIFSCLPRLRCFYSGIHVLEWPVLKHLKVSECTKVQTLVSEFSSFRENYEEKIIVQCPLLLVDEISFPCLEELVLSQLPELLLLQQGNSQSSEVFKNLATLTVSECDKLTVIMPSSVSFPNLTTLKVTMCDGLISLVASPTARSLMQLTRMEISFCKRIEQIITVVDFGNEVTNEIVFKELNYLRLQYLPSLRSFCLGNCNLEFPSLDQVIVRECLKMETFS